MNQCDFRDANDSGIKSRTVPVWESKCVQSEERILATKSEENEWIWYSQVDPSIQVFPYLVNQWHLCVSSYEIKNLLVYQLTMPCNPRYHFGIYRWIILEPIWLHFFYACVSCWSDLQTTLRWLICRCALVESNAMINDISSRYCVTITDFINMNNW